MKCPFCAAENTSVKDSRESDEGKVVRRRRCCDSCKGKFTTFEKTQIRELIVIKRTGAKKPFDRHKIHNSIVTALRKRNFSIDQIEEISNKVIVELQNGDEKEISTRKIGNLIMQELAKIDLVAYIRFASVYKDFSSIQDFVKFINNIKKPL